MVFLNQIWEAGTWCLFSTGTLSQETSPPSSLVELSPTQPAAAQAVDTLGGNGSKGNERKVRKRRSEAQFSRHPFFQMIFPLDQETPWNLFRPFLPFRKFPHKAACSAGVWKMQASKNEKLCSSRGRSNKTSLFQTIFTYFHPFHKIRRIVFLQTFMSSQDGLCRFHCVVEAGRIFQTWVEIHGTLDAIWCSVVLAFFGPSVSINGWISMNYFFCIALSRY